MALTSIKSMRVTLLILAVLYAWLPSGMCVCQLQAALMPSPRQAGDQAPTEPVDDDDGPHECHCAGTKPICVVAAPPCLVNEAGPVQFAIAETSVFPIETTGLCISPVAPLPHVLHSPLYLTLRALLI
jgi:hypothetical protein